MAWAVERAVEILQLAASVGMMVGEIRQQEASVEKRAVVVRQQEALANLRAVVVIHLLVALAERTAVVILQQVALAGMKVGEILQQVAWAGTMVEEIRRQVASDLKVKVVHQMEALESLWEEAHHSTASTTRTLCHSRGIPCTFRMGPISSPLPASWVAPVV